MAGQVERNPWPHQNDEIPANVWIRCRHGYLKVMPPGDCTPFDGDRLYVPIEDALAARQQALLGVAGEFDEKASFYFRQEEKVKREERQDRESGKLKSDASYEATWNYSQGLGKGSERAADFCRKLAEKGSPDAS